MKKDWKKKLAESTVIEDEFVDDKKKEKEKESIMSYCSRLRTRLTEDTGTRRDPLMKIKRFKFENI